MRTPVHSVLIKLATAACTLLSGSVFLACTVVGEDEPGLDEAYDVGSHNPIVFGTAGCPLPPMTYAIQETAWDNMKEFLRDQGYPDSYLNTFIPKGATCPSNLDLALQLAYFVQQVRYRTGADKVDIIAASMGNPAVRTYLALGGNRYVHDYVSLVGVNHGTQAGVIGAQLQQQFGYPNFEQIKEAFPPYACLGQTVDAHDVQYLINGCLTPTGRTTYRDETPGSTRYLSIRNTIDELNIPSETACLNQSRQNDCSDPVNMAVTIPAGPCDFPPFNNMCPGHAQPVLDPGVWQTVFDFITAGDA